MGRCAFTDRGGKCLKLTAMEVLVKLKSPPLARVGAEKNYYRFRLGPDITLATGLRVTQPGAKMVPMPIELAAVDHAQGDEVDAYERLLTDAMRGHSLLFVREDALRRHGQWWTGARERVSRTCVRTGILGTQGSGQPGG
jgi:glucose-6-phosphate 1-dehydrogenase